MIPKSEEMRILVVEDLDYESDLALSHLRRAGMIFRSLRIETGPQMRKALTEFGPTLILSDFTLPEFDGFSAIEIAQELAPDTPLIFLSGTIGEERAIEALRRGAVDYVLKSNPSRLVPAVRRAVADAALRAERSRQASQIARLDRVLRMLGGINGLLLRIRDRTELFRETCRLAVHIGGYATAIALAKPPGASEIQPVASSGLEERSTATLRAELAASVARSTSIVGRVMRTADVFVCNETVDLDATASFSSLIVEAGFHSIVALPLLIDKTPVGVLVLTAREAGVVSDEELRMLRDVCGNLSFALTYLQKDTTVRFLSHFDPQTGLAKRSLFCDRLARHLSDARARRARYAVAVFDIEQLTVINDSFGRRMGDLLLQHVADRLKRHFPQTENMAHFSGGTFALMALIPTAADASNALATLQQQAATVFAEVFPIEDRTIPVTARVGLAMYPEDGTEANTLVQNAEAALRNARLSGERQLHYSAKKHSEAVARMSLLHKLRLALEQHQFELHYQPKVNVVTRRLEGVEALIRWRDPDSGLVAPAAFLPLLESSGLIIEVGQWVVQQAALDCQQWLRAGAPAVRIAVNVSPLQLRHADFTSVFLKSLQAWSTPRWGLDVEITEGALLEDSAAEIKKLKLLRANGVKIAIDDFGTGYSSLSRLATLPIDTLKIDRSFVSPLANDVAAQTLAKTIITLARAFKMTTVAEGVETQAQLDLLWQMGCDQSQGYLHSKPVPAGEFVQLLAHGKDRLMLPAYHDADA